MKDLTVIIPVHKYDESIKTMLDKALESFNKANSSNEASLIIVGPTKIVKELSEIYKDTQIQYVETKKSDFSSQINAAAKAVATKYFSILEFDDEYTENWFKNVETYINASYDVSVYLPLTEIVMADHPERGSVGYVNEAVWASSFSDEIGYLDLDCLQEYMNFNTTGGVFKTEDFLGIGGLKTSMKLSFWYEYMLRSVYNGKKIFVIPKVGYKHLLAREDSLSSEYNTNMGEKEADWWIDLAKKEYYFKTDRKKTYEE